MRISIFKFFIWALVGLTFFWFLSSFSINLPKYSSVALVYADCDEETGEGCEDDDGDDNDDGDGDDDEGDCAEQPGGCSSQSDEDQQKNYDDLERQLQEEEERRQAQNAARDCAEQPGGCTNDEEDGDDGGGGGGDNDCKWESKDPECDWGSNQSYEVEQNTCTGEYRRTNYKKSKACGADEEAPSPDCAEQPGGCTKDGGGGSRTCSSGYSCEEGFRCEEQDGQAQCIKMVDRPLISCKEHGKVFCEGGKRITKYGGRPASTGAEDDGCKYEFLVGENDEQCFIQDPSDPNKKTAEDGKVLVEGVADGEPGQIGCNRWIKELPQCDFSKKQVYDLSINACSGQPEKDNFQTVPGVCGAPLGEESPVEQKQAIDAKCQSGSQPVFYCDGSVCIEKKLAWNGTACIESFSNAEPGSCNNNCQGNQESSGQVTETQDKDYLCKVSGGPTTYYCDGSNCMAKSSSWNGSGCIESFKNVSKAYCENGCVGNTVTSGKPVEPAKPDPAINFTPAIKTAPGGEQNQPQAGPGPAQGATVGNAGDTCFYTETCEEGGGKACKGIIKNNGSCSYLSLVDPDCTPCSKQIVDTQSEDSLCQAGKCVKPGKVCRQDSDCPQPGQELNYLQPCEGGQQACRGTVNEAGEVVFGGKVSCSACTSDRINPNSDLAYCKLGLCLLGPGKACASEVDCAYTLPPPPPPPRRTPTTIPAPGAANAGRQFAANLERIQVLQGRIADYNQRQIERPFSETGEDYDDAIGRNEIAVEQEIALLTRENRELGEKARAQNTVFSTEQYDNRANAYQDLVQRQEEAREEARQLAESQLIGEGLLRRDQVVDLGPPSNVENGGLCDDGGGNLVDCARLQQVKDNPPLAAVGGFLGAVGAAIGDFWTGLTGPRAEPPAAVPFPEAPKDEPDTPTQNQPSDTSNGLCDDGGGNLVDCARLQQAAANPPLAGVGSVFGSLGSIAGGFIDAASNSFPSLIGRTFDTRSADAKAEQALDNSGIRAELEAAGVTVGNDPKAVAEAYRRLYPELTDEQKEKIKPIEEAAAEAEKLRQERNKAGLNFATFGLYDIYDDAVSAIDSRNRLLDDPGKKAIDDAITQGLIDRTEFTSFIPVWQVNSLCLENCDQNIESIDYAKAAAAYKRYLQTQGAPPEQVAEAENAGALWTETLNRTAAATLETGAVIGSGMAFGVIATLAPIGTDDLIRAGIKGFTRSAADDVVSVGGRLVGDGADDAASLAPIAARSLEAPPPALIDVADRFVAAGGDEAVLAPRDLRVLEQAGLKPSDLVVGLEPKFIDPKVADDLGQEVWKAVNIASDGYQKSFGRTELDEALKGIGLELPPSVVDDIFERGLNRVSGRNIQDVQAGLRDLAIEALEKPPADAGELLGAVRAAKVADGVPVRFNEFGQIVDESGNVVRPILSDPASAANRLGSGAVVIQEPGSARLISPSGTAESIVTSPSITQRVGAAIESITGKSRNELEDAATSLARSSGSDIENSVIRRSADDANKAGQPVENVVAGPVGNLPLPLRKPLQPVVANLIGPDNRVNPAAAQLLGQILAPVNGIARQAADRIAGRVPKQGVPIPAVVAPPAPKPANKAIEDIKAAFKADGMSSSGRKIDEFVAAKNPDGSIEYTVRPQYQPYKDLRRDDLIQELTPDAISKLDPQKVYNYLITSDGRIFIAEKVPDELGVKHIQIYGKVLEIDDKGIPRAARQPGVLQSGELRVDGFNGRIYIDLRSGTFSSYGAIRQWDPNPANLALLENAFESIVGKPAYAIRFAIPLTAGERNINLFDIRVAEARKGMDDPLALKGQVVYAGDRKDDISLAGIFGERVGGGAFGTTFADKDSGVLTKIFTSQAGAGISDLSQLEFYKMFGGEEGVPRFLGEVLDGRGVVIGFKQEFIPDAIPLAQFNARGLKLTKEEAEEAILRFERRVRLTGQANGDLAFGGGRLHTGNVLIQRVPDGKGGFKNVVREIDISGYNVDLVRDPNFIQEEVRNFALGIRKLVQ